MIRQTQQYSSDGSQVINRALVMVKFKVFLVGFQIHLTVISLVPVNYPIFSYAEDRRALKSENGFLKT